MRNALLTADMVDFFLDGELVESREGKAEEQADPAVQDKEGVAKSAVDLLWAASDGSGIGDTPMRGDGLSGPNGADFLSGIVADGKDKVHRRSAGLGELTPALAAQIYSGKPSGFELLEGVGMDATRGMAARAVSREVRLAAMIQEHLGHDGTGGVASAEK